MLMRELGGFMKNAAFKNGSSRFVFSILTICLSLTVYGDIEFDGGISAVIDYQVDGNVWIYDANVAMVEPAHILGYLVTGSGSVLDVYGGQIDYMMLISMHDQALPDGLVTVYGTDFAVDGVPVDPNTTELFLQGHLLSGVYEDGTPFAFPVDCAIVFGSNYVYTQTVKLGWVVSQPDIEVAELDCHFGQVDVDSMQVKSVTVNNQGSAALSLELLELTQGSAAQFSMALFDELPVIVEPNSFINLEVSFAPSAEGVDTAVLSIFCDDPDEPVVDVVLTGEGVIVNLSPEALIDQLQDDYIFSVENNTIQGIGNINSASNKIKTFGEMLAAADGLIEAGMYESAILTLQIIEAKCDGRKSPADFIQGEGAAELNAKVNELIAALQ